jgi:hypothetical protein
MAVLIYYYGEAKHDQLSVTIIIPGVLLVVLYVSHGPLDHWWLSKFPIPFDSRLREWLLKYFEPYYKMSEEARSKFEYRMTLYLDARLFQSVGSELREVPEDIKCMVAAHGVLMTLGTDDYLMGDMDRIYLYKHPFPSPEMPFLHNVETNAEDGVIIISLEQLTNAVLNPTLYYNIAFHAYAEAFIATQKNIIYPDCTESWDAVEKISSWSRETIQIQTGLQQLNLLVINITLFFSKPEQYREALPQFADRFSQIFKIQDIAAKH